MHAEDIDWTSLDGTIVPQAGDHLHIEGPVATDPKVRFSEAYRSSELE